MAKTIWIMRHAENHRDEGLGLAVTETGIQNTHQIGQLMAQTENNAPVLIVSSSSLRGQQTATILKEEFERQNKPAHAAANDRIASLRDADLVTFLHVIRNLDEVCTLEDIAVPSSLVLIIHKQNQMMPILGAFMDPVAFANDYKTTGGEPLPIEFFENAAELTDEELMGLFGAEIKPLEDPNFLDALQFELREDKWSSFDFQCAQFRRKLELSANTPSP